MLRSRVTFGHGPFVFGEHFNADGTIDNQKVHDTVIIDERISDPVFRDTRDPYHLTTGGALGAVHKGMAFYRLRGRILVPDGAAQQSRLSDRERELRAALDPSLCLRDSPASDGAYTLDWDEITADLTTYPSGRLPQRIYARPAAQPQLVERLGDGTVRQYAIGFVAPDPRLYEQTVGSASGTTGPVSIVNRGSIPGLLRVTITMSAAGASNFTITRSAVSFVLDLSTLIAADEVEIVMETCGPFGIGRAIRKNGVNAFALKTSGPTTWLDAPSGTTSFTHANTTGIVSVAYEWGHARP